MGFDLGKLGGLLFGTPGGIDPRAKAELWNSLGLFDNATNDAQDYGSQQSAFTNNLDSQLGVQRAAGVPGDDGRLTPNFGLLRSNLVAGNAQKIMDMIRQRKIQLAMQRMGLVSQIAGQTQRPATGGLVQTAASIYGAMHGAGALGVAGQQQQQQPQNYTSSLGLPMSQTDWQNKQIVEL